MFCLWGFTFFVPKICSDEYDNWTCMLLGVQAELSVIMLDLNMVIFLTHGFHVSLAKNINYQCFKALYTWLNLFWHDHVILPVLQDIGHGTWIKYSFWVGLVHLCLFNCYWCCFPSPSFCPPGKYHYLFIHESLLTDNTLMIYPFSRTLRRWRSWACLCQVLYFFRLYLEHSLINQTFHYPLMEY